MATRTSVTVQIGPDRGMPKTKTYDFSSATEATNFAAKIINMQMVKVKEVRAAPTMSIEDAVTDVKSVLGAFIR